MNATKILGVWLSEDLSFERNTREICRKAYMRVSMLTKLKYIGIQTEELLNIYILFIRSVTEYCSVLFHPSLTQEQSEAIEKIQAVCLRVILGDNYVSYVAATEMCGLEFLSTRREKRCLTFSQKAIDHPLNKRMFSLTVKSDNHNLRNREKFQVNFARTQSYSQSSIPYCQRKLNDYFKNK